MACQWRAAETVCKNSRIEFPKKLQPVPQIVIIGKLQSTHPLIHTSSSRVVPRSAIINEATIEYIYRMLHIRNPLPNQCSSIIGFHFPWLFQCRKFPFADELINRMFWCCMPPLRVESGEWRADPLPFLSMHIPLQSTVIVEYHTSKLSQMK